MLVVRQGTVKHDGEIYVAGQILPDMIRKEAQRLIQLGVAAVVEEPKPVDTPKAQKGTKGKATPAPATPAPAAPPTPPAEEGAPANPAAAGDGEDDEDGDDEGGDGQPPVDLNIDPTENIKADKATGKK